MPSESSAVFGTRAADLMPSNGESAAKVDGPPPVKTVFSAAITVGADTGVSCKFMVTDAVARTVQVGDDRNRPYQVTTSGIDRNTRGELRIPETVSCTYQGAVYRYRVTAIGAWSFYDCENITKTGLATNSVITSVGEQAFSQCYGLVWTGLEHNSAVKSVGAGAFQNCVGLEHTGLATNTTVEILDHGAFSLCTALKKTGLETNKKIKVLIGTFRGCTKLESTGLAENGTVQILEPSDLENPWEYGAFLGCTALTDTGLASNKSVTQVGMASFENCTSLRSTGLETNDTVTSIGECAFLGCDQLCASDTGTLNKGDLVLCQPQAKEKGSTGKLSVGELAFKDCPNVASLYLRGDKGSIAFADDALSGNTPIERLFVSASWKGTSSWSGGGKEFSGDKLIIMDPLEGAQPAIRRKMTSDVATLTVRANTSFTAQVSGARSGPIGSCRFETDATGAPQDAAAELSGLDASGDDLTISIGLPPDTGSDAGAAIYPQGRRGHPYNEATGSAVCSLPAVIYTIRFDAAAADASGDMPDEPMVYDVEKPLSANAFIRSHRDFTGWNTRADGTGIAYDPGASVSNLTNLQGAAVPLYAQWKSSVSLKLTVRARSSASADPSRPLAGCGLRLLIDPGGSERWAGTTGPDGLASVADLTPGAYCLDNNRAPAGFQLMGTQRAFEIGFDGQVTMDGRTFEPTAGVFEIGLDFLHNPDLPSAGGRTLAAPPVVVAGAAALMLSMAYLVACGRQGG